MLLTPDSVRKKIPHTTLDNSYLESFIADAMLFVTERLKNASDPISEEIKGQLICWVAAHYVAGVDPPSVEEKIGDASISVNAQQSITEADGLQTTWWGKQALSLDPTGTLGVLPGTLGFLPRLVAL